MTEFDPTIAALHDHLAKAPSTDALHQDQGVRLVREQHIEIGARVVDLVSELYAPSFGKRMMSAISNPKGDKIPSQFSLDTEIFRREKRDYVGKKLEVAHRYQIERLDGVVRAAWVATVSDADKPGHVSGKTTDTELAVITSPLRRDLGNDMSVMVQNPSSPSFELLIDPESSWWDLIKNSLLSAKPHRPKRHSPKTGSTNRNMVGIEIGLGLAPGSLFPKNR